MLQAQIEMIRQRDPALAGRIAAAPAARIEWSASRTGPLTGSLDTGDAALSLASRYDPLTEAGRLIEKVDPKKHGCIVVLGLGVGHHVAMLAQRMGGHGVLVVFEPDPGLLRAVLEKVDCRDWLSLPNVILADDQTDRAALIRRIEPVAAMVTQGTALLHHPPTRQRCGEAVERFGRLIVDAMTYLRMQVATIMVNAARTHSNLAMNLGRYAAGATTDPLHGAASGHPAVCVGAGPSLARNVDLLADPHVRRRVVVICAQTTLKPLLSRGIRPDIVTALDYSAISKRFYEDLPALDEVTLVAQPLAHPDVLDSFPGPIRLTQSPFLDRLLGERARPRVAVPYGATVAHLSFYVAQHLGCDPIMLIGQDLGFSDGLYYCPGTAIHDVWAPELGPFNTLEMMQWQRIVRFRQHLHRARDIHGRPIFTDEQMLTYLHQFERDFAAAEQTVLDCTEGGLAKQHTRAMPLAEALAEHARRDVPPLPRPGRTLDGDRLEGAAASLRQRLSQVRRLHELSGETLPLLRRLTGCGESDPEFGRTYAQVDARRRAVAQLEDAFALVNEVNAVGVFKRFRADRGLALEQEESQRRQRQIERDIENVSWIMQACEETRGIFQSALDRIEQQVDASPSTETASWPISLAPSH